MTPITVFRGKTVAVFGLGTSGLAACAALKAGGAEAIAYDDQPASVAQAAAKGFATRELREIDWPRVAALVLAPGVPLTHPKPHWAVQLARKHGVEIVGDIELFCRERRASAPRAPLIAVTGTNGKSTTTALVGHLLQAAGRAVAVGGNLGTPILTLPPPAAQRTHVIECSSYQIDLAPTLDASVGILLNVTPDHLDRHGTLANYAAIKERLVAGVEDGGTAVVGVDDEFCAAAADRIARAGKPVVRISVERKLAEGIYRDGTKLIVGDGASVDLAGIGSLRGVHNAQNAAAAYAAARALELAHDAIVSGLRSFPGLAHRMEEVGRKGRVLFVNDSKATNADAAAKALASFTDIFWIAGGRAKEGGIDSLAQFFPRIRKAYLIGEAASAFAARVGKVPHEMAGTLERAVPLAARDAEASGLAAPVVLFSPACASFDQYRNFEVRGDAFKQVVRGLL
jgi:UDP-N-acetylmuramoylalanine--D-glutamate ligase